MIKIVIFDMVDIFYSTKYIRKIEKSLEQMIKKKKPKIFDDNGEIWKKIALKTKTGSMTLKEARLKYIKKIGLKREFIIEYEKIEDKLTKKIHLKYKNLKKILFTLRKEGYKTVILTNTSHNKKYKEKILKTLGIENLIDDIFCSSEIGYLKPDKKAYMHILNKFNILPEEAIFIGHDKKEILSAKSVGIHTIRFNKNVKDIIIKENGVFYEK